MATRVRAALDAAFPTRTIASHVTEFFPYVLYYKQDAAEGAAAFATTLLELVRSGVSLAVAYPLCSSGENRTNGTGWGLFDEESQPGEALWRRLTHGLAMFGVLAQEAPALLPTDYTSPSEDGVAVLAGKSSGAVLARSSEAGSSEAGSSAATLLRVLVSSQASQQSSVAVALRGLVPNSTWQFTVEVVDDPGGVAPTERAGGVAAASVDGRLNVTFALPPPAVALVRLRCLSCAAEAR